jgi:hypothetical protein
MDWVRVELGEGGAALGPQRVRLVQDRRNPPLLGERWKRDLDSGDNRLRYLLERRAVSEALQVGPITPKPVVQKLGVDPFALRHEALEPLIRCHRDGIDGDMANGRSGTEQHGFGWQNRSGATLQAASRDLARRVRDVCAIELAQVLRRGPADIAVPVR